jgi:hypothetical protein
MPDFLITITRRQHDTSLHYVFFVRQAQDNLHACMDAWYALKREFEGVREEDWLLAEHEVPNGRGPHRIEI